MRLKHHPQVKLPKIDLLAIKDPEVARVLSDYSRMLYDVFRNIYDDEQLLKKVENAGSALPTAAEEYRGRFMYKENAGAEDTLHYCVYDASGGTYSWKQVTLT